MFGAPRRCAGTTTRCPRGGLRTRDGSTAGSAACAASPCYRPGFELGVELRCVRVHTPIISSRLSMHMWNTMCSGIVCEWPMSVSCHRRDASAGLQRRQGTHRAKPQRSSSWTRVASASSAAWVSDVASAEASKSTVARWRRMARALNRRRRTASPSYRCAASTPAGRPDLLDKLQVKRCQA